MHRLAVRALRLRFFRRVRRAARLRRWLRTKIDVDGLLAPVLATEAFLLTDVARKAHCRMGGVVRLLSRNAKEQCGCEPRHALALARALIAIAELRIAALFYILERL